MTMDAVDSALLTTFDICWTLLDVCHKCLLAERDAALQSHASELELRLMEANMIDTTVETVVTLADAARLLPRRRAGRKCSTSTLYRWTTRGCRGTVLESIQIGATKCTSMQALNRFFQRLTDRSTHACQPIRPIPHGVIRPDQVDAELDRLGLGRNEPRGHHPAAKS
jgi:hypothetical protein